MRRVVAEMPIFPGAAGAVLAMMGVVRISAVGKFRLEVGFGHHAFMDYDDESP